MFSSSLERWCFSSCLLRHHTLRTTWRRPHTHLCITKTQTVLVSSCRIYCYSIDCIHLSLLFELHLANYHQCAEESHSPTCNVWHEVCKPISVCSWRLHRIRNDILNFLSPMKTRSVPSALGFPNHRTELRYIGSTLQKFLLHTLLYGEKIFQTGLQKKSLART